MSKHHWLYWLDEIGDYLNAHRDMHPTEDMLDSLKKLNAAVARSMRLKLEREVKK